MQHKIEIWKQVDGWPYEVSSLGRVRRSGPAVTNTYKGKILKPGVKRRYLGVTLSRKGETKSGMIHVLVCTAFHGPKPSSSHHAAHKNGNLFDNRSKNLYWASPKENEADKEIHGKKIEGSKHPLSKLTESDVIIMRAMLILKRWSQKEIAELFGINKSKVSHINTGISWKHI